MDPPCYGRRTLQALSECKDGDDFAIFYPQERGQEADEEEKLMAYVEDGDFCHLVNSCAAMLQKPFAAHNLDVCEAQACKVFHADRCAEYVVPDKETAATGSWRAWYVPWTMVGLKNQNFDNVDPV
mmetsp:Transcript_31731/g.74117  ORF Transcript_31731/g.74117 Transcript_31731/m.74117 type:complete len:126 (-) Transcript_31731:119-496(-)